jgi:hypothetical protein
MKRDSLPPFANIVKALFHADFSSFSGLFGVLPPPRRRRRGRALSPEFLEFWPELV